MRFAATTIRTAIPTARHGATWASSSRAASRKPAARAAEIVIRATPAVGAVAVGAAVEVVVVPADSAKPRNTDLDDR